MNKPDWIRYFNSELSFGDFSWHIFVFSTGKRLFKQWLCAPLCNPASINDRSGVAYSRLSRSVEKSWIAGGRNCITSVCSDNKMTTTKCCTPAIRSSPPTERAWNMLVWCSLFSRLYSLSAKRGSVGVMRHKSESQIKNFIKSANGIFEHDVRWVCLKILKDIWWIS